MRKFITAAALGILALSAVGAHQVNTNPTPVAPTARRADIYNSPAAFRHRAAQPTHWISQVLMPRHQVGAR